MTDFAVTGKKRSGKGLFCAGLIRDALREGRRVATNMDIFPEHLVSPHNKTCFIRLPDHPTAQDMNALGQGYEGNEVDEEMDGTPANVVTAFPAEGTSSTNAASALAAS